MKRIVFLLGFIIFMASCVFVQAKEVGAAKWDSAAIDKAKTEYNAARGDLKFDSGIATLNAKSTDAVKPKSTSVPTGLFNKSMLQPRNKSLFTATKPQLHFNKTVVGDKRMSFNSRAAGLNFSKSGGNQKKGFGLSGRKHFQFQKTDFIAIPKRVIAPQSEIK